MKDTEEKSSVSLNASGSKLQREHASELKSLQAEIDAEAALKKAKTSEVKFGKACAFRRMAFTVL